MVSAFHIEPKKGHLHQFFFIKTKEFSFTFTFILVYPNVTKILIFETVFWASLQHCPMSENNVTKVNGICVW